MPESVRDREEGCCLGGVDKLICEIFGDWILFVS